jgi:signal peptidase
MFWKGLSVITLSPTPIVCVISESMAPAFHRGDILFLWNRPSCVEIGEVPVVWFRGNPLPMVHRAFRTHNIDCNAKDASKRSVRIKEENRRSSLDNRQMILTKGDNNQYDDVSLYPAGREYATRDEVYGVVRGYIPFLGWAVIALQEVYWIKYLIFAGFAVMSLLER